MRSRRNNHRQSGFTLIEVMAASVILSVFVLGIGAMWQAAGNRVTDLTVRQQAVFVLNAEMERLTALYSWTNFGDGGPVTSGDYGGGGLPNERLIYPTNVDDWVGGGGLSDDFVTSSTSRFQDSPFLLWHDDNFWSYWDRIYVWIDQDANVTGQLSWTTQAIDVDDCIGADICSCHDFDGSDNPFFQSHCRVLELYLEYPYRRQPDGDMEAMDNLRTISLTTIVGRL